MSHGNAVEFHGTAPTPPLSAEGQAALAALEEAAQFYRGGALSQALARLSHLPELEALTKVRDLAEARRWIERAIQRIQGEAGSGPKGIAPVAACLRAAANQIARG